MFQALSRSWSLVKASAAVLRSDSELLVLPLLSSIAALLVAATFLLPVLSLRVFEGGEIGPLGALIGFAFYLCQYFVIFFFNSALVGAAMIRLQGGDPTVADGLRIATGKLGAILGYAAIAATVGLLLKIISERSGRIGRIITGLLGTAWTFATFLVVPVLVTRDIGPLDAVKESAVLLKRTWGENLAGKVGIGAAFGLLSFMVVGSGVALALLAAVNGAVGLAIAIGVLAVLALILLSVVQAALSGIYAAALYRYAVDGHAPAGFEGAMLGSAFTVR